MIGRLRGIILEKQPPLVLLETAGVGYEVHMPMTCFYELPEAGQEAIVFTHFVVREDAQLLYGFNNKQERTLFKELIKTNGVGPKLALAILSGMSAAMLIQSIEMQDISTLTRIVGVGKKTAERLVIELRDRLQGLTSTSADGVVTQIGLGAASPVAEAEAALVSLGYKPLEAQKAIGAVKAQHTETADLIRAALKSMLRT